ncbi:MAG TPA: hypothetical protein PLJ21_01695 [Pseudobdellovibrionaceae bacterium]|nr:hypothetical protein [Pseudobdellovibrionaceae bacterium]
MRSKLLFSVLFLSSAPLLAQAQTQMEAGVCTTGQCEVDGVNINNTASLVQSVQSADQSLNTPHYVQNLFDINIEFDLGTVNKGAALLNGSLGFLSKFKTLQKLAKENHFDLKSDRIETPYKTATILSQLRAVLNSQGEIIGFQIGAKDQFTLNLEKKDSTAPTVEKLDTVVLPLSLINGRSEVSLSVDAGLSRQLLSITDAKLDSKTGGTLTLGFLQSAALGGQHKVELQISKDSDGRFIAKQINEIKASNYGDGVDLSFDTASSSDSDKRIESLQVKGGVIHTNLVVKKTDLPQVNETFVQGAERSDIEAGVQVMTKLLNSYQNQSTELVQGTGAQVKVTVR